ncbi:MAG: glycoside hydrolase family 32 protein, partial [Isosphaeraceae bacterium]
QMPVDGFKGKRLVNSFYNGDDTTGTLTSPAFTIERKYITFLIGGGKDREKLCINLVIDGKPVRTATGPNDSPGGSEALAPEMWDVGELSGKSAVIQIIDHAKGGWGHINVDHIVQSDRRLPIILTDVKREIPVEKRYLNLPIKDGGPRRKVTILIDGRVEVVNDIELADGEPAWWAVLDARAWKGKTIALQVDKLAEDSRALTSIEQGDSIKDAQNLYREPLRGQFHFSTRRGWNNDPNGMVFFGGEYHLFYQHNPYGWSWGNMHWGHAVSRDMIHWKELGDELAPDRLGPMFSGSAVVDWNNTSGFGRDGKPPLVLIYTAAGNPTTQCIAYSTDGRTFTKYGGNPVLKQITSGNRDPKVIWHEPTGRWVMVLYVGLNQSHTIHFFTSRDLREWTLASVTEGGTMGRDGYLFECPDFFELPIDGDAGRKKWILLAANTEYATGTFNGTTFRPEQSRLPGQRGRGFYAPQTFSDITSRDGRRIQIGWFQTSTKGMPFNQSMTIPLELKLVSTKDGPRMTWTPVKELDSLRTRSYRLDPMTLKPNDANPLASLKAELVDVEAEFEPGDASEVAFNVRGATIVYDVKTQELLVNDLRAPAPLREGRQRLRILCDRIGLEIFAGDGLTYVPMPYFPKADDLSFGVQARGGSARIGELRVHELKSAWSAPEIKASSSVQNE